MPGIPLDPAAAIAALPNDAEICGCNGVCKGKITGAIAGLGLKSLDEVRAHTKASASCGSCTGLVEQLLKAQLGEAYNPAAVQPMCGCTDLARRRERLSSPGAESIPSSCRDWRGRPRVAATSAGRREHTSVHWTASMASSQSRSSTSASRNSRRTAPNSVVPRCGRPTATGTARHADIVESTRSRRKVTGGQRIDMLVSPGGPAGVWPIWRGRQGSARLRKACARDDLVGNDCAASGPRIRRGWASSARIHVGLVGASPGPARGSGCRATAPSDLQGHRRDCIDYGYDINSTAAGMEIRATSFGPPDTERKRASHRRLTQLNESISLSEASQVGTRRAGDHPRIMGGGAPRILTTARLLQSSRRTIPGQRDPGTTSTSSDGRRTHPAESGMSALEDLIEVCPTTHPLAAAGRAHAEHAAHSFGRRATRWSRARTAVHTKRPLSEGI